MEEEHAENIKFSVCEHFVHELQLIKKLPKDLLNPLLGLLVETFILHHRK